MKPKTKNDGYLYIGLLLNGQRRSCFNIHILVAQEFIPNPMDKPTVHHIDSKAKLNNTIGNLRWTTPQEEQSKKAKQRITSSQYKGVSWQKAGRRWCVKIYVNTQSVYVGLFKSEEEAALAYNKKAIEHFGALAILNVIQHNQDDESSGSGSSSGS